MPVPMEISTQTDFKTVFPSQVPYCNVKESKQNVKTLQIEYEGRKINVRLL